jgi:hypothetical protein
VFEVWVLGFRVGVWSLGMSVRVDSQPGSTSTEERCNPATGTPENPSKVSISEKSQLWPLLHHLDVSRLVFESHRYL